LIRANKLPSEALKELLEHIGEAPIPVLEDIIKNLEKLSGEIIAALLALKNLPPAIREKLLKEVSNNNNVKQKLNSKT
jgi:hypothetical protein